MKRIILTGFLGLVLACPVFAQKTEDKEAAQAGSADISAIKLGNELAKFGYASQSAASLIEAARILSSVPTRAFVAESTERGPAVKDAEAKQSKVEFDVKKLLADAKRMAKNDDALLALARRVENTPVAAGRTNGPGRTYERVNARSYDQYNVRFRGGELAEVVVIGDGDTDLDLYVYDENGNLVASDTDYTDNCYVRWYPKWTGNFRIKIVNRGYVYNNYVLITN